MVVQCPNCGAKGRLDDAKVPDQGAFVKCRTCGKRLRIHKTEGVSLAEAGTATPKTAPHQAAAAPREAPSPGEPAAGTPERSPTPTQQPAAPVAPQPQTQQPQAQQPQAQQPQAQQPQAQQPLSQPSQPGGTLSFKEPAPPAQAQGKQPGAAPAGQTASPQDAPSQGAPPQGAPIVPCRVCGSSFSSTEMIRFGNTMVCAQCKPKYVQMHKTGISPTRQRHYGGFWIRLIAKFVDGLLMGMLSLLIIIPFGVVMFRSGGTDPSSFSSMTFFGGGIFSNILQIALGAAYTTFFLGKFRATPGKMIFKLIVVTPDGGNVSYMRALGRHFSEWISWLIIGIGYIMAAFDSEKKALHDRICGTRVVYK